MLETFRTGREHTGSALKSKNYFTLDSHRIMKKSQQKIQSTMTEMHTSHSELKPDNVEKQIHVGLRGEL